MILCYKEYLLTVDVRLLPGIGLTFDRFERQLICNAFCYCLGFDQLSDGFLLFRNDFHLAIRPKIGWNVSHSFKPWFPDVIYVFLAAGPLLVGVDGNILVSRGHSFESIRGRFALSFLPFPLSSSSASRDVLFHPPTSEFAFSHSRTIQSKFPFIVMASPQPFYTSNCPSNCYWMFCFQFKNQ